MRGWQWWRGTLWRMLAWAAGLGFVTLIVCVSIPPLSDWTQELGACRNADSIEREVRDGGAVRSRGPGGGASTTEVSTTVFTLACHYGDQVRYVDNDAAVVRGFGVGFALGAIPGLLIGLALRVRDRLRRRDRPAALEPG